MAYFSDTTLKQNAFLVRLQDMAAGIAKRNQQRRVYKTTLNELNELSNRELADLGMSRSGLRRIALEAAETV